MERIRYHRGFTLLELLVVLTIITIITTVVLTSQSSFNKTILLSNTAYDIALTLRSAETFGLSSRALGTTVNTGYGVHFQSGTPGSFIMFADMYPGPNASNCHGLPVGGVSAPNANPGNCSYDAGFGELVQTYTLGNGIKISNFCAQISGAYVCSSGGGITSLDIVFERPNPNAFISVNGAYSVAFPATSACIEISSPQGGVKYITVAASGQISANGASCP